MKNPKNWSTFTKQHWHKNGDITSKWSVVVANEHLNMSSFCNHLLHLIYFPYVFQCRNTTWGRKDVLVSTVYHHTNQFPHTSWTSDHLYNIWGPHLLYGLFQNVKLEVYILTSPRTINGSKKARPNCACDYDIDEWLTSNIDLPIHHNWTIRPNPSLPHILY